MTRKLIFVVVVLAFLGAPAWVLYPVEAKLIAFPNGKRFAFSIIDDTDMTTLERAKPVYEVLERYGLRTTKTVWVYASNDESHPPNRGDTLSDAAYREFVVDLQRKGFEIALHGVRGGSSRREDTLRGLDEFKRQLGDYPRMYVNHSLNKENLYWGRHLFTFVPFRWATAAAIRHEFSGHDPASEYFWGDAAKERIKFVRRFTFPDVNLLDVNPSLPYRLDDKPYVNYWFPTSNGDRIRQFTRLLSTENLERLNRDGGVCLVYAHLGAGSFNKDGGVDPRFEARIKELASYDGWFAPASDILEHLMQQPSWTGALSLRERVRLDAHFITVRLRYGLD